MTGAFLNALGILLGSLFGLARRKPLSLATQVFFRNALGAATVFCGLRLAWLSIGGSVSTVLKQICFAVLSVMLGNLFGKLLRLQKLSNRLGRRAANVITAAQKNPPGKTADALNACAILFCASPLGLLGAVTDALSGYFYFLAVKAVMDALAMISFVKIFRWPVALSAFAVFLFLGAISISCQFYVRPFLDAHHLVDSVNASAALVGCAVSLTIFEVRKVELANYLPALLIAPLLAWIFHG